MTTTDTAAKLRERHFLSPLTLFKRKRLLALIDSKAGDAVLQEIEDEQLARRRVLIAELSSLEKPRPAEVEHHEAICSRLNREAEQAESAALTARRAAVAATLAGAAADMRYETACAARLNELRDGSDARLADFIRHATWIVDMDLAVAPQYWVDPGQSRKHGHTVQGTNLFDSVIPAREAMQRVIADAHAARLQALSFDEVSALLRRWCEQVAPLLAKLQTNPPSLTADASEVWARLKWRGASHWIVDEPSVPTTEDRDADRAELRAKAERPMPTERAARGAR